jgi:hypothetical protein
MLIERAFERDERRGARSDGERRSESVGGGGRLADALFRFAHGERLERGRSREPEQPERDEAVFSLRRRDEGLACSRLVARGQREHGPREIGSERLGCVLTRRVAVCGGTCGIRVGHRRSEVALEQIAQERRLTRATCSVERVALARLVRARDDCATERCQRVLVRREQIRRVAPSSGDRLANDAHERE